MATADGSRKRSAHHSVFSAVHYPNAWVDASSADRWAPRGTVVDTHGGEASMDTAMVSWAYCGNTSMETQATRARVDTTHTDIRNESKQVQQSIWDAAKLSLDNGVFVSVDMRLRRPNNV